MSSRRCQLGLFEPLEPRILLAGDAISAARIAHVEVSTPAPAPSVAQLSHRLTDAPWGAQNTLPAAPLTTADTRIALLSPVAEGLTRSASPLTIVAPSATKVTSLQTNIALPATRVAPLPTKVAPLPTRVAPPPTRITSLRTSVALSSVSLEPRPVPVLRTSVVQLPEVRLPDTRLTDARLPEARITGVSRYAEIETTVLKRLDTRFVERELVRPEESATRPSAAEDAQPGSPQQRSDLSDSKPSIRVSDTPPAKEDPTLVVPPPTAAELFAETDATYLATGATYQPPLDGTFDLRSYAPVGASSTSSAAVPANSRASEIDALTLGETLIVTLNNAPVVSETPTANNRADPERVSGVASMAVLTVTMGHPLSRLVVATDGGDGASALSASGAPQTKGTGLRRRRKSMRRRGSGPSGGEFAESRQVPRDTLPQKVARASLADLAIVAYLASDQPREAGDQAAPGQVASVPVEPDWHRATLHLGAGSIVAGAALVALDRYRTTRQERRWLKPCRPSYTGTTVTGS